MSTTSRNQNRLYIAFALFITSILAAFAISLAANKSQSYWVLNRPLPAGVQLSASDLTQARALISYSPHAYLLSDTNPIGSITRRNLYKGEILNAEALTRDLKFRSTEEVSLSIRASDIPAQADVGDYVTLYQLHDSRNGEIAQPPQRILTSAFISSIEGESGNFGGELSITVALSSEKVPQLLAATSSGRIVIVASHG